MNRSAWYGLSLLGLAAVVAWYFWHRGTHEIHMESTVLSDAVLQVSNVDLKDRIDITEDVVVGFTFLPQVPWPDNESWMLVLSLVPEGAEYSAAKSQVMFRCTARSSVSLGLMTKGQVGQFSPPKPALGDPRCYYYSVLTHREIPFSGKCRLEVLLLKTPQGKTNNYGHFSPMVPTCIFRRVIEVVRE